MRVAVNLASIDKGALSRGGWLLGPGAAVCATRLDVLLQLLPNAPELPHRTRIRLYHGTAEIMGRVLLLERSVLAPGCSAPAQLLLEAPTYARAGDRFVLRRYAPQSLLGGGSVLVAASRPHKRHNPGMLTILTSLSQGDAPGALEQALLASGRRPLTLLELRALAPDSETWLQGWLETNAWGCDDAYWHIKTAPTLLEELATSLEAFHLASPWRLGLPLEALAKALAFPVRAMGQLIALGVLEERVKHVGKLVALNAHKPDFSPVQAAARQAIFSTFERQPFVDWGDLGLSSEHQPLLDDLLQGGEILVVGAGIFVEASRCEALKDVLRGHFSKHQTLTASEARLLIGTTRKYLIPFLEFLDAQGFSRRQGDIRCLKERKGEK
jgi:selenocysteine-specific elongation factor